MCLCPLTERLHNFKANPNYGKSQLRRQIHDAATLWVRPQIRRPLRGGMRISGRRGGRTSRLDEPSKADQTREMF